MENHRSSAYAVMLHEEVLFGYILKEKKLSYIG